MGSPKDFLAKQIRTTQVMASGSFGGEYPDLLIYRTTEAPNYDGVLPPHIEASIGGTAGELSIGKDVWFYVDAADGPNHPIGQTGDSGTVREDNSVVLFAGDVVVSGTLWSERHVMEVTEVNVDKFEGDMILSGNLFARDQYSGTASPSSQYLAPGANQWVDFQNTGGSSLFVVDSENERVGIHTSDPLFDLHIVDDREANARFAITQYADDNAGDGPDIMLQRSRGDLSAGASGVVDGDRLGSIYFQGAAGPTGILGNDQIAAAVSAVVQGSPTTGDGGVPAAIGWRTGDGTEATLKWRLASSADGRIGIGGHNATKTGDAQLHIIWSSATGAGVTGTFDPGATSMLVGDGPLKIEGLELDTTATKNLVISDDGVVKYGYATIGPPCPTTLCDDGVDDNTYTDGLFMDWTELTPLGCAIDRMNEVLGSMAPQPAPLCNSLDATVEMTGGGLVNSEFQWCSLSESGPHPQWSADPDGATAWGTEEIFPGASGPTGMFPTRAQLDTYSVTSSGPYPDDENTRGATSPTSHEKDHQLGVFFGDASDMARRPRFKSIINWNDDKDPNVGGASGANYPAGAFGRGDQGLLELIVNGEVAVSLPLDSNDAAFSVTNVPNDCKISVGSLEPAHYDNGEELCTYYHRVSGDIEIGADLQRIGWNWARIRHHGTDMVDEGDGIFSSYITWLLDDNETAPAVASAQLPVLTGLTAGSWLSGVLYLTSATIQYGYEIENAYRNVYKGASVQAIKFTDNSPSGWAGAVGGNGLSLPVNTSLPDPAAYGDVITTYSTQNRPILGPACDQVNTWRVGATIKMTVTVEHPFDNDDIGPNSAWGGGTWTGCNGAAVDAGWSETFLVYDSGYGATSMSYSGVPSANCDSITAERFRTEYYRLEDTNAGGVQTQIAYGGTNNSDYAQQTDIEVGNGTNAWKNEQSLDGPNPLPPAGYRGLLCCAGYLTAPKNTSHTGVTNGDFEAITYPTNGSDTNYSSETGGLHMRWFYRAFKNDTGGTEAGWKIILKTGNDAGGNITDIIPVGDSITGSNNTTCGHLEVKLPDGGGYTTGWLDCAKKFQQGNWVDGDGALGPAYTTPTNCISTHRVCSTDDAEIICTLGTREVGVDEWIIVRFSASEQWDGSLNEISIDWGF